MGFYNTNFKELYMASIGRITLKDVNGNENDDFKRLSAFIDKLQE